MKKLLAASAAITALMASTSAFAESTDVITVNMTGNVQQICTAVPVSTIQGQNWNGGSGTLTTSDDNVNVAFNFGIANTDDPTLTSIGQTGQAYFSIGFKTFCNDDFTVTVQSDKGAFTTPAAAPAGFVNSLPYGYTLKTIGGTSVVVNTASTAEVPLSSAPFNGQTQIDVNVKPSTTPPVAGDYTEKMTITFAADAA
jgi:hypothetical protein